MSNLSSRKISLNSISLNSLIENAPYGICYTTLKGEFLYTNRYYQDMTGYSDVELLEMRFYDLTYPDDRDLNMDLISSSIDNFTPAKFQKRYVTKSGGIIHVRIIVKPEIVEGQKVLVALAENITELISYKKRIDQQDIALIRNQRMNAIGKLAGIISHDFNNILSLISGYSQLIEMNHDDVEKILAYNRKITEASNRAEELVSKLMVASSKNVYTKDCISMSAILNDLEDSCRTLLGKDINLIMDVQEDLVVKADKIQIEQILINLILNSKEAISGAGEVRIEASINRNTFYDLSAYVQLVVHDTGCGISSENIPYIFEPFFTTKSEGTGLGMASVYGLTKSLAGHIEIESLQGDGSFTKVTIFIPSQDPSLLRSDEENRTVTNVRPEEVNRRKNILLVDDNVELTGVLREVISPYHNVEVFTDPTLVKEPHIRNKDLLITDVSMPKIDGPMLVKNVRGINPQIPVIFISGYPQSEIGELLEFPRMKFLKKPVKIDELLEIIGEIE